MAPVGSVSYLTHTPSFCESSVVDGLGVIHAYLASNKGKVVTRFQFSELFCEAWEKGMTAKNIRAGFKTTGIYPFNPKELIYEEPAAIASPFSLCKRTGLKYIPFYSPATSRFQRSCLSQLEIYDSSLSSPSYDSLDVSDSRDPSPSLPPISFSKMSGFDFNEEKMKAVIILVTEDMNCG